MRKRMKKLGSLFLAFSLSLGSFSPMASVMAQAAKAQADTSVVTAVEETSGPQMGWSSWNYFQGNINETNIKEIAQAMVDSGLNEYGYEYVNLDDCWMDLERDADGKLQWKKDTFPNGSKIIQEINEMAGADSQHPLKVGLYSAASDVTCQKYPASYWHEETDARSFAEWGAEYLKYDYCHVDLTADFLTDAPDIDSISVGDNTYQAEAGTLTGNATSQDGYVTMLSRGGGAVTFQVTVTEAGTYPMTVSYKTYGTTYGKGRYIQAIVNDDKDEFYDAFIPSVDTMTIGTCVINVPLKTGSNTIKLHNPVTGHQTDSARRYKKMANALKKATAEVAAEKGVEEKPIFYSVCDSGVGQGWNWAPDFSGSWRIGHDIVPYWEESDVPSFVNWSHTTIMSAYDTAVELWQYQKPGAYNDPDMMQVGNGDLTYEENKSHFSLWCMLSAPLILGNDVREFVKKDENGNVVIDHEACNGAYDIVTNSEMIRVNQEGMQCKRVYHSSDLDILVKPLTDGEIAVCFLNRGKDTISASYDLRKVAEDDTRASLPESAAYKAVDLWAEGLQEKVTGHILESGEIPSHGVKVYRVSATEADREVRIVLGSMEQMRLMQECTIEAYVENLGKTQMEQTNVMLELPEGFHVSSNSENKTILAGGETALYSWKVIPMSDAESGTMKVSLSYQFADETEVQRKEASRPFTVSMDKLPDEILLSEMEWVSSSNGDGVIQRNRSNGGNALRVGTETYENGVGVHAVSEICVDLGGGNYRFTAVAGLDRESVDSIRNANLSNTTNCSVTFELWADGVKIYDSGLVKYNASDGDNYDKSKVDIDVTIKGCHKLVLRVGNGDGYNWDDHADWVDAKFTKLVSYWEKDELLLSEMNWMSSSNGDGAIQRNRSNGGNTLRVGTEAYENGVGVHAESEICVDLGGGSYQFTAVAGLDRESVDQVRQNGTNGTNCSVTFELWADGVKIYDSGLVKYNANDEEDYSKTKVDIDVTITKCHKLVLRVGNGDGYNWDDHADWADAKFTNLRPKRPAKTEILGDANGDGVLDVADVVRVKVELASGDRLASEGVLFANGKRATEKDTAAIRRLLVQDAGGVAVKVTGVDTRPNIAVKNEAGDTVDSSAGGFIAILPVGAYAVTAESETAVVKTENVNVAKGNLAEVTIKALTKLEAATYKNQWGGDTGEFKFEADTGIYRGTYDVYSSGVFVKPRAVTSSDEWVLETDVQIISDSQNPSAGVALYNGNDFAQNVKFEIVRNTPAGGTQEGHEWFVQMNGVRYVKGDTGNDTVHSDWVAEHQEALKGKIHMAVVHKNDGYYMFLDGSCVCALGGDDAVNLTNGWDSIRLGFYAEQEAAFENWNCSTEEEDIARYLNGEYAVEGSIAVDSAIDFNAVQVNIVNWNGDTVKTVTPDTNGNFTVELAYGTYFISAKNDSLVSDVTEVNVAGYNINGISVVLDRPVLTQETGNLAYDYKTGNYSTDHYDGDNQAYFATAAGGQPFVLETTMKNMSTSQWPSAGFILNAGGDSWVKFVVRYAEDHYDMVVWRNIWDSPLYCAKVWDFPTEEMKANPFTGVDDTLKLRVEYFGSSYSVYVNDVLMFELGQNNEIQNSHTVSSILGSGDVKLGLFAERQITFTDWSYKPLLRAETGKWIYDDKAGSYSTVHEEGDNQAYFATVASGQPFMLETTMKNMSTSQWPSAGFILNAGGDSWVKFVVRKTDTNYDMVVWRHIWNTDKYGAKVYQFPEQMQANPFTGPGDTLKLRMEYSGSKYSVYVNEQLMFELDQNAEELYGDNGVVHSVAGILGSSDVRLGLFAERQITFTDWSYRPMLRVEKGNMTFNYLTGEYSTVDEDGDNQAYFAAVTSGQPFVLETTMKNMGTTDWSSAGFVLNAGEDRWVKFVVRRNAGNYYDLVVWRDIWGTDKYGAKVLQFPEEMKANPFTGSGGILKLRLVYSGSRYSVYVNEKLIFELDQNAAELQGDNGVTHSIAGILGSGDVRLGLFAEHQITFKDWSCSYTQSN